MLAKNQKGNIDLSILFMKIFKIMSLQLTSGLVYLQSVFRIELED